MSNDDLVERVINSKFYLRNKSPKDERVPEAMKQVDRRDFLGPISESRNIFKLLKSHITKRSAYRNIPLPIGYGQTCSSPEIVAVMESQLDLEEGIKVLEIGTGCGYHAANTSHLIGSSGYLVTIERIPELVEFAHRNLTAHFGKEYLESRINVILGDGSMGLEGTTFDRIYLTAGIGSSFEPSILARQLNPEGGILLYPEKMGRLIKEIYENGKLMNEGETVVYDGVAFVPLIGQNA